jgi:hypothetical protein
MKSLATAAFIILWVMLSAATGTAQSAILKEEAGAVTIEVVLNKRLREGARPKAALFLVRDGDRVQVRDFQEEVTSVNYPASFTLRYPSNPAPGPAFDPKAKYEVAVLAPTVNSPTATLMTVPVTRALLISVARKAVGCESGIAVFATSKRPYDWEPEFRWLAAFRPDELQSRVAKLKIILPGREPKDYSISSFSTNEEFAAEENKQMLICLKTEEPLPTETFSAEIQFQGDAPAEFAQVLKPEGLAGDTPVAIAKYEEVQQISKRKLERNLDLGLSFTSSVADVTTPATCDMPAMTTRERANRGVLDVRFAPWLNVLTTPIVYNRRLWFLTPVYLNANVATGKITKDTLGLNQVMIGTEGELRYYHAKTIEDPTSPIGERGVIPWVHRVIGGLANVSDRDFKQAEFVGKIDYMPIIDAVYKPLSLNWRADGKGGQIYGRFGYAFKPKIGFELGRTYLRREPAEAVKPSGAVRRLALGSEMALDLTRYLTLSAIDMFYVRYETQDNRYRNYFKAQIEGGLGTPTGYRSQSVFVSFERGQLPPFSLPNVNVFKVGFRIRADFCGQNCR